MKLSLNWLEEFLGARVGMAPADIAQKFLDLGFEVGSFQEYPAVKGVIVGKTLSVGKHPNADRLKIVKVTDGTRSEDVVCGAPNVAEGQTVFWARSGAVLADGAKVSEAVIRGVKSPGMLCSARELGAGDLAGTGQAGLWILGDGIPPGTRLEELASMEDVVFDVEVTPNRPDCLSVIGLAREAAAALDLKVAWPAPLAEDDSLPFYPVTIEDRAGCPRYVARRIERVRVAPSPFKTQLRLLRAGVRPINNVVDAANIAMLETGQPLHAFDAGLLEGGKIVVRRARAGEKILALDGKTYDLDPEILVIADAARPVAVAGVMGGQDSAVTERTENVLLESALFDRGRVRASRAKLNLASESSYRFERGTSSWSCLTGSWRARETLCQGAGGLVRSFSDTRAETSKPRPAAVTVRISQAEKVLGEKIPPAEIARIFQRLGFHLFDTGELGLGVQKPDWRLDLEAEIDFIEEIARIRGYEKTPSRGADVRLDVSGKLLRTRRGLSRVRQTLAALGFSECRNYGLVPRRQAEKFSPRGALAAISNPLSEEQSAVRPCLLWELLSNVKRNLSYQKKDVRLFEAGRVSRRDGGEFMEEERIALAACGKARPPSWRVPSPAAVDFYWARGVLEELFRRCGAPGGDFVFQRTGKTDGEADPFPGFFLHPAESFLILPRREENGSGGRPRAGVFGRIHPVLARSLDLDPATYLAEFSFDFLFQDPEDKRMEKISVQPFVKRDCSIWVAEETQWLDVRREIERSAGPLLKGLELFDLYRDGGHPGRKSLSFALTFQHPDKTLDDETANHLRDQTVEALSKKFRAELRSK